MWNDFLAALALLLVIEGLLPFAAPGLMRNLWAQISQLPERSLRLAGFFSMIAGAVLLYIIRQF